MLKKIKFENILIIIIAVILIIVIIIITYLNYLTQRANRKALRQQAENITQQTPTPRTILIPTTYKLEGKTETIYDTKSLDRVLEKVQNRKTLSENDYTAIRKTLISILPEDAVSGKLYESPNIIISYIGSPDIFQVEITTTNITQAKKEAVGWFLNQGFSQDAICNYPVQFYLNFKIKQELSSTNTNLLFNSLAPGCQ